MKFLSIIVLFLSSSAYAFCPDLYPPKEQIRIEGTVELCNSFYVSLYDEKNKAVILTSEKLSKDAKVGAMNRKDSFRADGRVTGSPNASSYSKSGYDRGHMVPSDDASTELEMFDTFLMTNMTPQVPSLNRISWRKLEEHIRKEFKENPQDTWIVTIAVYPSDSTKLKSGVPIPSGYWKIVYRDNKRDLYYADNKVNALVSRPETLTYILQK